jgi:S-phase kinase-associated protein 1
MMKPYIWLQTSDGSIQQVEQEIAMFCPFICQEIIQKGTGSSKNCAICLPEKVSPAMLSLVLDYCRFHQVPGRSNKVLPLYLMLFHHHCHYVYKRQYKDEKQSVSKLI